MRMRKIQNGGGSGSDGYAPHIKMERLPRAPETGTHELFVEMDELVQNADGLYEWRQKSRSGSILYFEVMVRVIV